MESTTVCSLGSLCHTASFLKRNKLKKESYPFDWIFTNLNNVINCVEDDFKMFLDKSYYINVSDKGCGHTLYNKNSLHTVNNKPIFNHHNPLIHEEDYQYYVRCVDRFQELLKSDEHKLFIFTYFNLTKIDENMKTEAVLFNERFKKYTKNYTLLIIFHIAKQSNNNAFFTSDENVHFLELHTLSSSGGTKFDFNEGDNIFMDNVIHDWMLTLQN